MKKILFIILLACFSLQAQKPSPMKGGAIINWNGEPSFHVAGWLLYDTSENQLKVSNGTSWIDINAGFDADIVGESLLLSKTMNGQGLKFDVSENNNGIYNILLNANNEANSGLNFGLGSGNYNVTFWDYLDNKLLEITTGYIRAPSLTIAQQSNARSLVTLEKVQDLISNGNGGSGEFDTTSNYTLSGNWVFDNPIEVADPTTADEAVNLRYFEANTLSNELPFYDLDVDTYTITEAQIENLTTIYVNANQTDVTITIPNTSLTGQNFINIQHLGTGTITIIPDTGVNLQQYVSTSDKSFILASITANTWFLRDGDVTVSTYTPPVELVTPTFVQSYFNTDAGSDVTVTITNAVENDVLIAYFSNNAGTPVTPTGWTELGKTNWSTYVDYVAYMKVSDGTETSVTFSNGGGTAVRGLAIVSQYTGVDTNVPVSDFQVVTALEGTVIPTPSLTSTGTNRRAIVTFLTPKYDFNDGALIEPSTYTLDTSGQSTTSGGTSVYVYSKDLLTATTQPGVQVTVPKSGFYAAFTLLLNPSN